MEVQLSSWKILRKHGRACRTKIMNVSTICNGHPTDIAILVGVDRYWRCRKLDRTQHEEEARDTLTYT